jgi:hypothetical protein
MGIEHVYVEYDPTKPVNRVNLCGRKLVHAIDLTNVEGPSSNSVVRGSLQISFTTNLSGALPYGGLNVRFFAVFPPGATGVITPGNLPIVSNGFVDVPVPYTTLYTLTVTHNGVYDTRELTISVTPPAQPSITSFGRSGNAPLYVTENTSVTLTAVFDHGTNHQGSPFAQITPGDAQGPYELTSNGTVTIPVGTRGAVTYTLTVVNNFTNVGIAASITINVVALPNILSFDRMNALSPFPLYIRDPETVTLRAVFTGGSGQLITTSGTVLVSNVFTNTNFNVEVFAQTYTLRVTSLAGAFTEQTITFLATPYPMPPPILSSNINNVAPNATVILSVSTFSNAGYAEITPGNLSIASGGSVPVNPSSTQLYTLRVYDLTWTLAHTAFVTVTVVPTIPNPVINTFNNSYNNVAPNTDVTLTSFFTGGTGRIMPGNYTVSNGQTITVRPLVTTTYTLTVTNSINVSVTQDRTINVVFNPVIHSFSRSANNIAPGTDVTLTSFFTGETGRIMPGNYTVSNGQTITVAPLVTTTYTLTVTISNNVVTQDRTIDVVPTISNPVINSFNRSLNNVAPGTDVTLTSFFTGGTGRIMPGNYTVTNGQTITVAPLFTTTYTLTVTNANNVSATQDRTIDVVPLPTISSFTSNVNNVTPNSNVTLLANFTGGTGSVSNGIWNFPITTSIFVAVDTTTTYTLTVTNSSGSVMRTHQVIVVPNPVINSFNRSFNNVAPGTDVTLTSFFTGGTGRIMPGNYTVTNGQTITVAPLFTTTYTLTVTNANNVSATQDRTIDVVSITPDLNVNTGYVTLGQAFQVFYVVPINTSVTVTLTSQFNNLVLVSGTDFNIVNTSEDTTSLPGGRQVLLDYQLLIDNLTAFANRYAFNWFVCNISVQGQGVNLSAQVYIEGDP